MRIYDALPMRMRFYGGVSATYSRDAPGFSRLIPSFCLDASMVTRLASERNDKPHATGNVLQMRDYARRHTTAQRACQGSC